MRTLVLGTGKSGLAVARYLLDQKEHVVVSDRRERSELEGSANWEAFLKLETDHADRFSWALGGHPLELLERCDQIVISPGVPLHIPFLCQALERGIKVLGEMELAYRACRPPLIAVTGTNGKSTICSLVGGMLGDDGLVGGNIGTPLLDLVCDPSTEVNWVVAEVSSFQLETVHEFRPRIAVLSNITPDHLDHHKDLVEYETAKSRLFAQLDVTSSAIFCADDPAAMRIAEKLRTRTLPRWVDGFPEPVAGPSPKILTYSVRGPVPNGVGIVSESDGQQWVVHCVDERVEKLFVWDFPNLPGKAMMSNGLAAVIVGLEAGLSLPNIQSALRSFQSLCYRMERVGVLDGVTYINDSKATNIESTLAAAESVSGNLAVIVGGKDKGVDYRGLAQGLKKRDGRVFLIGEATTAIEQAFVAVGFENYERSKTLERAFDEATTFLSGDGGTVLLAPACSSFDQFNSAEHRGQVFNDLVGKREQMRSRPR